MAKIIVKTDAEYYPAKDAEHDRAIEQARALAPTIGVEMETAECCVRWLEAPVVVEGSFDARDLRTDSDEQRIAAFTSKAKSLQAQRDKNATK